MISKSPQNIFSDSDEEEDVFFAPASSQVRENVAGKFTSPSPILFQSHTRGSSRSRSPIISSLHEERRSPAPVTPAYSVVNFDGGRMKVRCMPADGDCLFASALHQLCSDSLPSSEDIICLRFKVSRYIRENVSLYKEFYPESVINNYIRDIRNRHVWGGYESIVAIANIFQRTVEVFRELGTIQEFQPHVPVTGPALRVAYRCNIDDESSELVYNHYDSVVDVEEEPCQSGRTTALPYTECQQTLSDLLAREIPRALGPAASDDVDGDCSCHGKATVPPDDAESDCSCPSLQSLSPKRKIATPRDSRLESEVSPVRHSAPMLSATSESIVRRGVSGQGARKSAGRLSLKKRKKDDVPRPPLDVLPSQHPEVPVPEVSYRDVSTFIKTVNDVVVINECTCIGPSSVSRSRIEGRVRRSVSTNVTVASGQMIGTFQLC